MDIKNTTVYTKERLIRFSDYFARTRMPMWIIYAVLTLFILACDVFLFTRDALEGHIILLSVLVIMIDLLMVFFFAVLPRLTVKKANNLDACLNYSFGEEEVSLESEGELFRDKTSFKYQAIVKIGRYKDDIYLFISKRQAFIVDLSSMSEDEVLALKAKLTLNVSPDKIKW